MKKTDYYQRAKALSEWVLSALIQGMPLSQIQRVEKEFYERDEMIRRWEEQANYYHSQGDENQRDLAMREAHEIHGELVGYLEIKRFAA